jgi:bifunctional UDP-N-acetylglucosamine pyrophosphorylase / glucosamine-1-phosphate N-acetyltransferase
MNRPRLACIILAAGKGTRMKSALPKVLHRLGHKPLIGHVITAAETLSAQRIIAVVGPGMESVAAAARPHLTVVQESQNGTGDAVRAALPALADFTSGTVLVLFGDTPLMTPQTLERLAAAVGPAPAPAVAVLGVPVPAENAFGRMVVTGDILERIVEVKDATPAERALPIGNAGVMAIDAAVLADLLGRLEPSKATGELYLTDLVALARGTGRDVRLVTGEPVEATGINSRADLAAAEELFQQRLRSKAMADGVTLIAPQTVWLAADTKLGRDVIIHPNVVIGPGVEIADGVEIQAFSHLEGVTIGKDSRIGPFARLRPGAELGPDVHVGNFVEVKNATLAAGAKANHLTYIGDADIGAGSNIGAGTITCNYDGYLKHRTRIGAGVLIGSNTALVAPVSVGDRAVVGAGSVIIRDVPAEAVSVARGEQKTAEGRATRYHDEKAAEKAAAKKSG